MVSARMLLGRSIGMVAGRSGDGVAVDGEFNNLHHLLQII